MTIHHPKSESFSEILKSIRAGSIDREANRRNPFAEINTLSSAGFGKIRLKKEDGGLGFSIRETIEAVISLAGADSNIAHALRSHFLVTESRRHLVGDPWIALAAQSKIFGIATAERTTKKIDSRDYATALTREGVNWRLNGEKSYSTGSIFADWLQVSASLPDGSVASVFVDAKAPGVHHHDDWDGFGQRLTGSGTTTFVDVHIPEGQVAPWSAPSGLEEGHVYYRGTFAQLYLLATAVGIIEAIADDARDIVRARHRAFSHASSQIVADDPLIQHVAGQIDGYAYVARAGVLSAARSIDAAAATMGADGKIDPALGHKAALDVARIKAPIEEFATKSATLLFEIGGASTTSSGKNLDRHWRNARTVASHNPTLFKTRAVGDHLINDRKIPATGFF